MTRMYFMYPDSENLDTYGVFHQTTVNGLHRVYVLALVRFPHWGRDLTWSERVRDTYRWQKGIY